MKPLLRIALLVLLGLALCGALAVASLSQHDADLEGEVRLLVAATRERWEQHDFRREPLGGSGTAGNAFDAYRDAIALGEALPAEVLARADAITNDRTLWSAEDAGRLALFDPAITLLRSGACRQEARPQLDWSRGADQEWLDAISCMRLLRVALQQLAHTSPASDQTALTLDLATCCGDLLGSPSLVEQMVGSFGLDGLITHWSDERIAAAGTDDRAALAAALGTLDNRTSCVPQWLGLDAALLAATKDPAAALPIPGWQACLAAWRTGFSPHRMMLGAIAEMMTGMASMSVEPDEAWPARTARLSAIERQLHSSENLATRMMAIRIQDVEFERRKTLCRLRLLRVALAWHTGSTLPPLRDPFGSGTLRVVANGSTAEFTSAHAGRDLCRTSTRP